MADPKPRKTFKKQEKEPETKQTDLLWFEYETRLRKVVQELLEPTIRRSKEDRELYEIMNKKYDDQLKKIDDLEFMINKTQKRQAIFEEIFRKMNVLEMERKAEDKNLNSDIMKNRAMIETLQMEKQQLQENLKATDNFANQLNGEINKVLSTFAEYRRSLNEVVEEIRKQTIETSDEFKSFREQTLNKFKSTDEMRQDMKKQINQNSASIESVKNSTKEIIFKIGKMERNTTTCITKVEKFQKHIDSIKETKIKADEIETKTKAVETYLDKYLTLYTQAQISETLYSCISTEAKKRLFEFEEQKFREINLEIINDDGKADIVQRIENMYYIIEPQIKKYERVMEFGTAGRPIYLNEFSEELDGEDYSASRRITTQDDHMSFYEFQRSKEFIKTEESEQSPIRGPMTIQKQDTSHSRKNTDDFRLMTNQTNASRKNTGLDPIKSRQDVGDEPQFTQMTTEGGQQGAGKSGGQFVISELKEEMQAKFKKMRDEFNSKFGRLNMEQFQLNESTAIAIKELYEDVNKIVEDLKDNKLPTEFKPATPRIREVSKKPDKETQKHIHKIDKKIKHMAENIEKLFAYERRLTDIVTPLIESVNSIFAILMKEEKKKRSIVTLIQKTVNQQSPKGFSHQATVKKKTGMPYIGRSPPGEEDFVKTSLEKKVDDIEENEDVTSYDIKIKYDGKLIPKIDFLQITFDSFKGCLLFSTRCRMQKNFKLLFEKEIQKYLVGFKKPKEIKKRGEDDVADDDYDGENLNDGDEPQNERKQRLREIKQMLLENNHTGSSDRKHPRMATNQDIASAHDSIMNEEEKAQIRKGQRYSVMNPAGLDDEDSVTGKPTQFNFGEIEPVTVKKPGFAGRKLRPGSREVKQDLNKTFQ